MNNEVYEEHYSKNKGFYYRIMDLTKWLESNEYYETDSDPKSYVTTCPYCLEAYTHDTSYHGPYNKMKLYITHDKKSGWCHRCNSAYFNNNEELKYQLPQLIKDVDSGDLDLSMNDPRWTLDKIQGTSLTTNHLKQLYDRNPFIMNLYKELNITSLDENNVIIPFYFQGDLIYYQLWRKGQSPKYFCPPIKTKPLYFCGPLRTKAILVEGVFDAIACRILYPNHTPIALLGHYLTGAQESMLRKYLFEEILIFMDESHLSYKIYNKLKRVLDFTDLIVVDSDGEDPEERLLRIIHERDNT